MLNMAVQTTMKFMSYNSRGHGKDRLDYIQHLMSNCDILFLQEHWFLEKDIKSLELYINDVHVYGVSGMNDHQLLVGRPYGGCALLINKNVKCSFSPLSINNRCCAGILKLPSGTEMLIFNVYMPCDTTTDLCNLATFQEVLQDISCTMSQNSHIEYVLIGGDCNTDLSRNLSLHSQALNHFVREGAFVYALNNSFADIQFTYENIATNSRSVIDHFICSENLHLSLSQYKSIHEGQNLSDHCPILLSISMDSVCHVEKTTRRFSPKAQWNKATEADIEKYKDTLEHILSNIQLPLDGLYCNNFFCSIHSGSLNSYCDKIVAACIEASDICIPTTRKRVIAGWKDHAEPVRNEAIFWHNLWVECGRPINGVVADIRRRTRAKYKQVVKYLKRCQKNIVADKMATSLQNSVRRDFWSEVKRQSGNKHSCVNSIDGHNGVDDVSQVFASKYKELYNSVTYNAIDMKRVMNSYVHGIHNKCEVDKCHTTHYVEVSEVQRAIKKLKSNKSDGVSSIMSDALINAPLSLHTHLSLLFSSIIAHGCLPNNMLLSTLIPIPKNNKKCLNDSSNYRAIALGSVIGKILDLIIMEKSASVFHSSDLQFGFKVGHSTTQCSFVIEEIIDYYNRHNSPVFLVTLDASKAFDRVEYCKLFELLLDRGICPVLGRFLITMYTNQKLRVNWNGVFSDVFVATNGVKQGGILSPILFCIYMDVLLQRLRQANIGCYIGDNFVGSLCYADDLCLLASTRRGVMKMLSICQEFGDEYKVLFNSEKSHVTVCTRNTKVISDINFQMYGQNIGKEHYVKHLGYFVGDPQCQRSNINKGINDLIIGTNYVMSRFGHCSSDVRNFLFRSYCTSYYGSPLWLLGGNDIDRFYCTWRKCIRRIWGVPNTTHCRYIPHLYGGFNIDIQIVCRFIAFLYGAYHSDNVIVSFCAKMCGVRSNSTVAVNRRYFLNLINDDGSILNTNVKLENLMKRIRQCDFVYINGIDYGKVIKELCLTRDGLFHTCLESTLIELLICELSSN